MNDLRAIVTAGDPVALHDALTLAAGMSLTAVRGQLNEEFLDANSDQASRFVRAWLSRLEPFERMQAASWASEQFLLSKVHLDHAHGIGVRLKMESLTAASAALAEELDGCGAFADGADAEVAVRLRGARCHPACGVRRTLAVGRRGVTVKGRSVPARGGGRDGDAPRPCPPGFRRRRGVRRPRS